MRCGIRRPPDRLAHRAFDGLRRLTRPAENRPRWLRGRKRMQDDNFGLLLPWNSERTVGSVVKLPEPESFNPRLALFGGLRRPSDGRIKVCVHRPEDNFMLDTHVRLLLLMVMFFVRHSTITPSFETPSVSRPELALSRYVVSGNILFFLFFWGSLDT